MPNDKRTKHGLYKHPLYRTWQNMTNRCGNPKHAQYKRYGGRGITICDEWRSHPESFVRYALDHGWKPGLSIDRIDNDGNYCAGNIRFVSLQENLHNREVTDAWRRSSGDNIRMAHILLKKGVICLDNGKRYTSISEAARAINRNLSSLSKAIHRGGKCAGLRFKFEQNNHCHKENP